MIGSSLPARGWRLVDACARYEVPGWRGVLSRGARPMDRRAIAISGIVQGVGFRPYVFALATRLGLGGFVRNQTGDVLIEVEGEPGSLDRFVDELTARPPPLARIDRVDWAP